MPFLNIISQDLNLFRSCRATSALLFTDYVGYSKYFLMLTVLFVGFLAQAQTYTCDTLNLVSDQIAPIDPYQVSLVSGHAEAFQAGQDPIRMDMNFERDTAVYEAEIGANQARVVRFSVSEGNRGILSFSEKNPLDETREFVLESFECSAAK